VVSFRLLRLLMVSSFQVQVGGGALLKVLDRPGLDLTTPTGQGILALLLGLAQEKRERIVRRANDGRTAARKRGAKFGRKPVLKDDQQKRAREMAAAGEGCRSIAKLLDVHHSTISRLRIV
jgi:DNA invertase Pin-like site-specific DNA recombinase